MKVLENISANIILGVSVLPKNAEIAYPKAIEHSNGRWGVLVKFNRTGLYSLFIDGSIISVNQAEAKKIVEGDR